MKHEISRLRAMGLGKKQIARALQVSRNTVRKYLDAIGAEEARALTVAPASGGSYSAPWAGHVDWAAVRTATNEGTALAHYWEEHIAGVGSVGDVSYNSFWREYRRRYPDIPLDLHQVYPPGQRCEIDYKGDAAGLGYVDPVNGEFVQCRLFGAILPFSQLGYVEATHDERQPAAFGAISSSFAYFGGVAATSVVDNAKICVSRADWYDPDVSPEFQRLCEHFGTAPLVTRPKHPKDKAHVEGFLGLFWRWAGPKIRRRTFRSLGELNAFLRELLDAFNNRVQRKYGISRRAKFEGGERVHLKELPGTAYETGTWRRHRVHPDCHIQVGHNFYSVPHVHRGKEVDVRVTPSFIEVFVSLDRVALHFAAREATRGRYQTKTEHLPDAQQAIREATPAAIIEQAKKVGPATAKIVTSLIEGGRHPLMFLRRAQGVVRLARRHSPAALEEACATLVGLNQSLPRLDDIEMIIRNTQAPPRSKLPTSKGTRRGANPNLRGQSHWTADPNVH